jgi:O-antigen/teichoic acid export membrane protein
MKTGHVGPSGSSDNTRTIARNSFWYGLELLFGLCAALVTSVAVARVMGPERLSYYQLMVWLTN